MEYNSIFNNANKCHTQSIWITHIPKKPNPIHSHRIVGLALADHKIGSISMKKFNFNIFLMLWSAKANPTVLS